MELFLLIVLIAKLNKWLLKNDRQLYTKQEYDELLAKSRAASGEVGEFHPGTGLDTRR
jgi:hypothetical protein